MHSLLIVDPWVNGLLIFLLKDPRAFILSASITASLDLWRHTSFFFTPASLGAPRPETFFYYAERTRLITAAANRLKTLAPISRYGTNYMEPITARRNCHRLWAFH